jgi:hypothetical protein
LVIKDDDLVVGTHGRGIWILDDITPLRQITADVLEADAFLFEPQQAWRFRWNKYTDTPMPPDEPAGENPPDGAVINYYLKADAVGPVMLEILTEGGELVRRYSSSDAPELPLEGQNVPDYWPRPARVLSAEAGLHRFIWDLHYPRPDVLRFSYPISAIAGNTPAMPVGPWVLPGRYTVKMTANGVTTTKPLTVKMDPRVKTPAAETERQFKLSMKLCDLLRQDFEALTEVRRFRADSSKTAIHDEASEVETSLTRLNGELQSLYGIVENADVGPASQVVEAIGARERALGEAIARWQALKK